MNKEEEAFASMERRMKRDDLLAHFVGCALTGLCHAEERKRYSSPEQLAGLACDIGSATYGQYINMLSEIGELCQKQGEGLEELENEVLEDVE